MKWTPPASNEYQPAPLVPLPYALLVELDLFIDEVVFAGHIMHVELGLRDDALGVVELGGFDRW